MRGIVVAEQSYRGSQRLVVRSDSMAGFRAIISVKEPSIRFATGDTVRVTGFIEPADAHSRLPFQPPVHLSERSAARLYAESGDIVLTGAAHGMHDLRHAILDRIYSSPLKDGSAALLASAWLGDDGLETSTRERFQAAGLAHLLCVSGFHLAILAAVVAAMLIWLNLFPRLRLLRPAAVIAAAWLFAMLTGMRPPVIRAAVMLSVYMLARMAERDSVPLNSLATAAIVIMIINPYWIYSIGFQLSVTAVAGIILMAPRLNPVQATKKTQRLHNAMSLLCVPLAAQIATAPVVLAHFHTLPLLGIPVNAMAIILFPPFMVSGAIAVGLSSAGFCPKGITALTDTLAVATDSLCDAAASAQTGILSGIYLSEGTLAALSAATVLTAAAMNMRGSYRKGSIVCALTALAFAGCGCAPAREALFFSSPYSRCVGIRTPDSAVVISRNSYIPVALQRYFEAHGSVPTVTDSDFTIHGAARRGNVLILGDKSYRLDSLPQKSCVSQF
ncbi:MAG: ComEC/Rec2 family competence protein [Muribaculaceae bacterium]|nr:ComEC/Rec2 family competence protein [Muribaculaceae bacterium]